MALLLTGCTKEARKTRLLSRAEQDFQSGAYDKARIEFLGVLRLDSKSSTAFLRLGQIWLEEGAPLRAAPFILRAKELAPQDADNHLRLTRIYIAIGRRAEAANEVLTVLQQSPANGDALTLLAEIAGTPEEIKGAEEAIQKFPSKETFSYHLATGNIALRKQDFVAAQQAIDRAIALAPKSPEAHQAMGILHLLQKDPKGAGEEFKVAAELAPARSNVQITYAEYQRQIGEGGAASVFLTNLTKKAPDFLPAWTLLGRMAFAEKKYDETLKFLENVFSRDPENVDARLLQSDSLLVKHEPKKAIEELERLDKTYPGLPPVQYRLA